MSITANIRHQRGDFRLDAQFTSAGRVTALYGPSGSGKTTIVKIFAGLIQPAHCKITIGDGPLVDSETRLVPPAHRRRIGYVSQDALLFPHLDVRRNLRFGEWFTPAARRSVS